MSRVYARSERLIEAQPEQVYAILVDYENKRPRMLPSNFLHYKVEEGGRGSGTIISYLLHAANRERPYRMLIDEAVPGKVINERDSDSSLITTWTVSPRANGSQTRVRVTTEWQGSQGIGGFFERTFAPLGLKRIYASMLEALSTMVQSSDRRNTDMQDDSSPSSRAGIFFLMFGLVMAFAFGLSYWQRRAQTKQSH